jgi:hypothetical protein
MNWVKEQIRTFAFLHYAAEWALKQAESATEDQIYPSMHAILASVHCLEAFTNHLGPHCFGDKWDTRKANLATHKEKLRALFDFYKINVAEVQTAYDSYILALRIRKALTHGRTHEIWKENDSQLVDGRIVTSTYPEWHKCCEPKTAQRVFEAVTLLLENLGEKSGEGRYCADLLAQGYGRSND